MSRNQLDSVLSRAFMAGISVILSFAVGFLRDMSRSINELNAKVAVVIAQTAEQQAINQDVERRLERVEASRKDSRSQGE